MAATNYKAFLEAAKLMIGINAVGFSITAMTRTHKITDLVGVGTFCIAAAYTLYKARNSENMTKTKKLLTFCVCLWSLRLSSFLCLRVIKAGEDHRLRFMFPNPNKPNQGWFTEGLRSKIFKLAFFWGIQALWGVLVLSPVTMANLYGSSVVKVSRLSWLGFAAFMFFFAYESTADLQKYLFKQNPDNIGKICTVGLYQYSRFPNYFGEIGIWFSLFLMASPILKPAHYWTVISPIFTFFLLNNVSGVPFLTDSWEKRYGDLKEYQEWKATTNKYLPGLFTSSKKEL